MCPGGRGGDQLGLRGRAQLEGRFDVDGEETRPRHNGRFVLAQVVEGVGDVGACLVQEGQLLEIEYQLLSSYFISLSYHDSSVVIIPVDTIKLFS